MLDHVLHRLAQPSGRIHSDQHKRCMPVRSVGKPFVDIGRQHWFDFAIEIQLYHEWIRGVLIRSGGWKHKKRCGDAGSAKKRKRVRTENPRTAKSSDQTMSAHCAPPDGFTFCKCSSNSFASGYLGASFSARSNSVRAKSNFFCSR